MKHHSSTSIILGHKNFGETDKLVFLYNEDLGKIKTIAKGARRITSKFTGHLESLNIYKTQLYFGPKNIILTEIETIKNFKEIRKNLTKTNCALQIMEVTNKLIFENQKVENLQNLLTETLTKINSSENPQIATMYYIIKLLDKTGMLPNFKETETKMDFKYRKFFNFIQKSSLREAGKIKMTDEETEKTKEIVSKIMEYHTL